MIHAAPRLGPGRPPTKLPLRPSTAQGPGNLALGLLVGIPLALLAAFGLLRWAGTGLSVAPAPAVTTGAAPVAMPQAAYAVPRPGLIIDRFYNLYQPNIVSPSLQQYLRLRIEIQFNDLTGRYATATVSERNNLQEDFLWEHTATYARFNDILTNTLDTKRPSQFESAEGKEALRQELMTKFNQALAGTPDRVVYISFLEFIVQ